MRYLVLSLCLVFSAGHLSAQALADVKPPKIQLASKYRNTVVVSDYFISEKLDGVRAYWDGQRLVSRQGKIFWTPKWFIKDFPSQPLDGELWIARQLFSKVSGIVRQKRHNNKNWQQVKFMVFDLPNSKVTFSRRLAQISKLIALSPSPYLKMIKQNRFNTEAQLMQQLNQVIIEGGEGLMLHRADALYQTKRSNDLMKLKRFEDAEATVLAHLTGKGKYQAMLGALLVKNQEGVTFKIGGGFSDIERANPPPIGSIITYKYYGKTNNNVPRFASFLRIRTSE